MQAEPKMTKSTVKVLRFFLENPGTDHHGFALTRETGVGSGTLYPLLDRLKESGWLEVRDEDRNEDFPGRPPRRFYGLTALGEARAAAGVARKEQGGRAVLGRPATA